MIDLRRCVDLRRCNVRQFTIATLGRLARRDPCVTINLLEWSGDLVPMQMSIHENQSSSPRSRENLMLEEQLPSVRTLSFASGTIGGFLVAVSAQVMLGHMNVEMAAMWHDLLASSAIQI